MPSNVNLTTDTLTLAAPSPSPLVGAHYPFKAALQPERWSASVAADRWQAGVTTRWSATLLGTA